MLRPRIIPCLLVHKGNLVKTTGFGDAKYVGDPINAVKIFNEKECDELAVLDIDATITGADPDLTMIANLAAECRMPLSYGGGVRTVEMAKRIIGLGVEKVSLSAAAIENSALVGAVAKEVGSQSVVVTIDTRQRPGSDDHEAFTHNGTRATGHDAIELAREMAERGAGEIVLNSIDRDGRMAGYDLDLAKRLRDAVNVPITILGGAGSLDDISALIRCVGTVGAAAGSLFVFKGRFRAVLINYPSGDARTAIAAQLAGA